MSDTQCPGCNSKNIGVSASLGGYKEYYCRSCGLSWSSGTAPAIDMSDTQTQTAHTPGPWLIENLEVRAEPSQKWPGGRRIADCYHNPPAGHFDAGENDANARLIAAAPDLLKALQTLLDAELYADRVGVTIDDHMRRSERVQLLQSAIAKATGQQ